MREQHSERLSGKGLTGSCPNCNAEATRCLKCFEKSYRAAKPERIEPDWISRSRRAWNTGDMFPGAGRQRRIDERYNLVQLSTSSYPARTRRNIEESDGLQRLLGGGTKLTWEHANKLGKPVLHIYDPGTNEY